MMLLSYGFAKVYKTQFPEPSLIRLLQPLGSFSPMGLAWTYMGFSEAYNMYTGMLEVLGGLLLIWRRTTTLGALLVAGVMSHVVVMNFTYDIPVKLLSMHLLEGLDIHFSIFIFLNSKGIFLSNIFGLVF